MAKYVFERGDTVAVEVRYAAGVDPKRITGTVIANGASGVHVSLPDGERWLKPSQVKLIASAEMQRAERLRKQRADERAEEAKMKRSVPEEPVGPECFRGEDYPMPPPADLAPAPRVLAPAPQPPPAPVVVASTIDALLAAGQDPFALFLAMGAALAGHQRDAVDEARKALRAATADVESARELLADAERRREAARDALESAEAKLAQVQNVTATVAPTRAA